MRARLEGAQHPSGGLSALRIEETHGLAEGGVVTASRTRRGIGGVVPRIVFRIPLPDRLGIGPRILVSLGLFDNLAPDVGPTQTIDAHARVGITGGGGGGAEVAGRGDGGPRDGGGHGQAALLLGGQVDVNVGVGAGRDGRGIEAHGGTEADAGFDFGFGGLGLLDQGFGFGFGGNLLPVDVDLLSWSLMSLGLNFSLSLDLLRLPPALEGHVDHGAAGLAAAAADAGVTSGAAAVRRTRHVHVPLGLGRQIGSVVVGVVVVAVVGHADNNVRS